MKKILGYAKIAKNLESCVEGGSEESQELRRLIKLSIVDIAGRTVSDTSAEARIQKIKSTILKRDFHAGHWGLVFDRDIERLVEMVIIDRGENSITTKISYVMSFVDTRAVEKSWTVAGMLKCPSCGARGVLYFTPKELRLIKGSMSAEIISRRGLSVFGGTIIPEYEWRKTGKLKCPLCGHGELKRSLKDSGYWNVSECFFYFFANLADKEKNAEV